MKMPGRLTEFFGRMIIYRRDIKQPRDRSRLEKFVELSIKSLILFSIPLPFTAGFLGSWYFLLYCKRLYFGGEMEAIITCAWIPIFAVLYGLVFSKVLDTVWAEYKQMRGAVKAGIRGVTRFVEIRDERVSPLIYAVIYVLSAAILAALMVIKYPSLFGGFTVVGSTSYLFSLFALIIREIDNPCGGIWFIRRIPGSWLRIDAYKFRKALAELADEQCQRVEVLEKLVTGCQIPAIV